jgi:hypothetical protein
MWGTFCRREERRRELAPRQRGQLQGEARSSMLPVEFAATGQLV